MTNWIKILVAVIVIFILIIAGYVFLLNGGKLSFGTSSGKPSHTVVIKGHTFSVFIQESDADKEKGLSGRQSLPQDEGMLFPFGQPNYYAFWMKDMKFPIDILYIRDSTIVTIYSNVPQPKNSQVPLTIYRPLQPADTVLEINAGLSNTYGFKIGDKVTEK